MTALKAGQSMIVAAETVTFQIESSSDVPTDDHDDQFDAFDKVHRGFVEGIPPVRHASSVEGVPPGQPKDEIMDPMYHPDFREESAAVPKSGAGSSNSVATKTDSIINFRAVSIARGG